jgi:serine/threonine protein kinase
MARIGGFQGVTAQGGRVLVGNDGAVTTGNWKGRVVSFFKGTYKAENNRAKEAFVGSLKQMYGPDVAERAARSVGLGNGKALNTRDVRKLLDEHVRINVTPGALQRGDLQVLLGKLDLTGKTASEVNSQREAVKNLVGALKPNSATLDRIVMASDQELRAVVVDLLTPPPAHPRSGFRRDSSHDLDDAVGALMGAIREGCPNRMSDGGTHVTIHGKLYKDPVVLGEGGAGVVKRFTTDAGETVVLKFSKPDQSLEPLEQLDVVRNEVKAHRYALGDEKKPLPGSELIVGLIGPIHVPGSHLPAIALSTCELGSAESLFRGKNSIDSAMKHGLITKNTANLVKAHVAWKLMGGAQFMQEKRQMVHLDLKPHNLFIGADGSIQIGDFGLAAPSHVKSADPEGTMAYSPLEMTLGGKKDIRMQADTATLGSILYELATGKLPFENARFLSNAKIAWYKEHESLIGGDQTTGDPAMDDLIRQLTHRDPMQRMALGDAMKQPMFSEIAANPALQQDAKDMFAMLAELSVLNRRADKLPASERGPIDGQIRRLMLDIEELDEKLSR